VSEEEDSLICPAPEEPEAQWIGEPIGRSFTRCTSVRGTSLN
jgi:hypothetical protein